MAKIIKEVKVLLWDPEIPGKHPQLTLTSEMDNEPKKKETIRMLTQAIVIALDHEEPKRVLQPPPGFNPLKVVGKG